MGDRKTSVDFYNAAVAACNDKSNPNHLQQAYALFSSACIADPTYGKAWYQCGNNNSDLNCHHAAVANWRRALQCEIDEDEHTKALVNLGWRLYCLGRVDEAEEATAEALTRSSGNDPLANVNMALICQLQDDSKSAVAFSRKAFELTPEDYNCEIAYAFSLLFDGQYELGFKHFEKRFEWRLRSFMQYPYPKWAGEEDKTVYLVADQGMGDTLSFARFVPEVVRRSKFVHLAIQRELYRSFTHAFANLPNLNIIPQPNPFPAADCWSTFVSLPAALKLNDEQIKETPPIRIAPWSISNQWKVTDRKIHIGIAWAGSPLNDIDRWRNIPLEFFLDLYDVPGVQLYSLQMSDRKKELQDSGCSALIPDLSGYISDVTDTVSLLQHLDLVITCESIMGHICAAADKECWIPYSFMGRDYRLGLMGEKALWTPKTKVFRQSARQDWKKPFNLIAEQLRARLSRPEYLEGRAA